MTINYINSLYERKMISKKSKETLIKEMFGDVTADDDRHFFAYKGKSAFLTHRMYDVVKFLLVNKNKYFSQEEIIKNVWESNIIVDYKTVNVHICKLRKTFPGIPIKIRKKVGYGWMD